MAMKKFAAHSFIEKNGSITLWSDEAGTGSNGQTMQQAIARTIESIELSFSLPPGSVAVEVAGPMPRTASKKLTF